MRVPSLQRIGFRFSLVALLIAGVIIGAALFNVIYSHNMDKLILINDDLRDQIVDLKEEIKVKDSNKPSNVISKIMVTIEEDMNKDPMDSHIIKEIETKVREQLSVYRGWKVDKFAETEEQEVISKLVSQRYYIKEKDYIIQLQSLTVIHSQIHVRITAKLFNPD